MPSKHSISVGVPIYKREFALRKLLSSIPEQVRTVYIADNGRYQDRDLYDESWSFELEVLHLDYDVGIAACRHAIAEANDEDYLWIGDCDMEFLDNGGLERLAAILDAAPSLGGVSGWLLEGDTVRSGARDLVEANGYLVKDATDADIEYAAGYPFARFDFVPQAGLFRREVFETYNYDSRVGSGEHIDFMLGHTEAGGWDFASTPAVMVKHNRDIDPEYRAERTADSGHRDVLQRKWGYKRTLTGASSEWRQRQDRTLPERAFDVFRDAMPAQVWIPTKFALERVVR